MQVFGLLMMSLKCRFRSQNTLYPLLCLFSSQLLLKLSHSVTGHYAVLIEFRHQVAEYH